MVTLYPEALWQLKALTVAPAPESGVPVLSLKETPLAVIYILHGQLQWLGELVAQPLSFLTAFKDRQHFGVIIVDRDFPVSS